MKGKIVATAFLLLLLITLGAEAAVCKIPSATYRGRCNDSMNCSTTCVSEGRDGGFCEGVLNRKCMCTTQCVDGGGEGDGNGGGGGGEGGDALRAPKFVARAQRAGGHA